MTAKQIFDATTLLYKIRDPTIKLELEKLFILETKNLRKATGVRYTGELKDLIANENEKWNKVNRYYQLTYGKSPIEENDYTNRIAPMMYPFMFSVGVKDLSGKGMPLSLFHVIY
jgi:hypothetical protein